MTEKDIEEIGQQYFDTIPKNESRPVQQNVEQLLEDLGEADVYVSNRVTREVRTGIEDKGEKKLEIMTEAMIGTMKTRQEQLLII